MSIGKRMAQVRSAQGLNQVDFAQLLEVPSSSYKNYERGAFDPPTSLVRQICERFSVDANWLLLGQQRPSEDELNRVAASVEFAFNFFEARDELVTAPKLVRAVAVVMNLLDSDGANAAQALPLLKQVFSESV
ncbi:helix-turn-helix domain-containing protein [Sandaracinobacteroides hominis]|uniref:helix-turn-helix domain-containing protein n=1 Tax=Sandaracinobacteroides hominis TaxID=2780086 RepID=UPI0018F3097B|nr:helix-turn-helix transcriptional regulator [Sandaracinobacteroides hominis]